MRALLHIGTEKTGSTALQHFLYQNEDALNAQNVFLTKHLWKPNNRKFAAYFSASPDEFWKMNGLSNDGDRDRYFENFRAEFEDFVEGLPKDATVIISSEHLHSRVREASEVEHVAEFLKSFFDDVKVVCYFREQSKMALSLYSTVLKISYTGSIDQFIREQSIDEDNYYYDFLSIARNWASAFGAENCIFRIYERRHLVEGDVRKDFLLSCGLSMEGCKFEADTGENRSMSYLHSLIFREINKLKRFDFADANGNESNLYLKSLYSKSIEPVGAISSESLRAIFHRFKKSNDTFFKEFFDSENLFSVPEYVPDARSGQLDLDAPAKSIEQILAVSLRTIDSSKAELQSTRSDLDGTWSELQSTWAKLNATWSDFQSVQSEFQSARSELERTRAELSRTTSELERTTSELARTQSELQAAKQTIRQILKYPWKYLRNFGARQL